MSSISVIIPTLNRADLLLESLETLKGQDYSRLIIIDNGNQSLLDDIDTKIDRLYLIRPGRNLGVAASWNLGITVGFEDPNVDFCLILNDDIVMFEDSIGRVQDVCIDYKEYWFLVGQFSWSTFLIARQCALYFLRKDGFIFDPGFWPGYCEDNDFHRRLNFIAPHLYVCNIVGLNPKLFRKSMTHERNPSVTHDRSLDYYVKKWGGPPGHELTVIGNELFLTPFGK